MARSSPAHGKVIRKRYQPGLKVENSAPPQRRLAKLRAADRPRRAHKSVHCVPACSTQDEESQTCTSLCSRRFHSRRHQRRFLGCTSFRGFCHERAGVATSAAARSLADAIVVLDARIYEASRVWRAFNNADLRQRVWRRSWISRPDFFRLQDDKCFMLQSNQQVNVALDAR